MRSFVLLLQSCNAKRNMQTCFLQVLAAALKFDLILVFIVENPKTGILSWDFLLA